MADEVSFTGTLSGTKDGVTVTGSFTGTQDLDGDVLFSDTLSLSAPAAWDVITFPAALVAEGISGIWIMADVGNTEDVNIALTGAVTYGFAKLKALGVGLPLLLRPYLDAAAGSPPLYWNSSAAAKIVVVAVGQSHIA